MTRDTDLAALHAAMRVCRRCGEAGFPVTPGAVFSGRATARVMVVGQAPGITEAASGTPFFGPSGRRLFRWLAEIGWDEETFRAEHYLTAVTKCFPGKGKGGRGDRAPSRAEQALCAPFLARELDFVAPCLVLAVGGAAIRTFLGAQPLDAVVGHTFSTPRGLVVPLPHPSGANLWLNLPANRDKLGRALAAARDVRDRLAL